MDLDLVRDGNSPLFQEELRRDFRPMEVREGNFQYRVLYPDGRFRLVHRRQRKVLFIDKRDANRLCEMVVQDLGPATAEDPWVIPCDGEVEWAQALELADWAKRKRDERQSREAWVNPLRREAMLASVQLKYEEAARRATGLSTFGPHQRVQRESR